MVPLWTNLKQKDMNTNLRLRYKADTGESPYLNVESELLTNMICVTMQNGEFTLTSYRLNTSAMTICQFIRPNMCVGLKIK